MVNDLLSDLSLDNSSVPFNSNFKESQSTTPGISLECIGSYLAYSRYGLDITFKRFQDSSTSPTIAPKISTTIKSVFLNDQSDYTITDLLLQIAVPKVFALFLNPPSTTRLGPHQEAIQIMTVQCLKATMPSLKLRVKVSFKVDEEAVEDLFDFVFPDL